MLSLDSDFNNAEGARSGCQTSGILMAHKSLIRSESHPPPNRPIRHSAQDHAQDSPRYWITLVTRYKLVSRGAREAKNKMKAGLFGSDESVLSTISRPITIFCLGVKSAFEMRDPSADKRFPWVQTVQSPRSNRSLPAGGHETEQPMNGMHAHFCPLACK